MGGFFFLAGQTSRSERQGRLSRVPDFRNQPVVHYSGAMQLKRLRVVGSSRPQSYQGFLSFMHNHGHRQRCAAFSRELMFHTGPNA